MLKGLIWFNSEELYNKCEVEARKVGLIGANDFIVDSTIKYLESINPKYSPIEVVDKKTGEKKLQKYFQKSLDLWIATKAQAEVENVTVSYLIERICHDIIYGKENKLVNNYPVSEPSLPYSSSEQEKRTGVFSKIGDAISLPRG